MQQFARATLPEGWRARPQDGIGLVSFRISGVLRAVNLREWASGLLGRTSSTGSRGELQAEQFLREQKGFRIIARNWRSPFDRRDELDLVCRDGEVLVFVEVKTRNAAALVRGYFAVNKRKKDVVRRAADVYLRSLPSGLRPRSFRFDVVEIAVVSGAAKGEVRHFENVPMFSKYFWR